MHLRLVFGPQPLMLASSELTQSTAKLLLGFGFTKSDSQHLIPQAVSLWIVELAKHPGGDPDMTVPVKAQETAYPV